MDLKVKDFFKNLTYPIFYTIIFLISCYLLKDGIINAEDRCYEFFYDGIKFYKNFFYGSWLMELENLLTFYIPHCLKTNIVDWSNSFGVLFQSFCYTLIIFFIGKVGKLRGLSPKIVLPVSFISYCSIFLMFCLYKDQILQTKTVELFIFLSFFRYFVASLLLVIFFYNLYKIYLNKKPSILLTMICAFFVGSAGEYTAAIAITTVTLAFLYKFLFEKIPFKELKSYVWIFATLWIGFGLLTCTEGFQAYYTRYSGEYHFSLAKVISDIPDFGKMYIQRLIFNYWYVHAILIGLFAFSYKKDKKNISKNIFPFFIVTGTLAFSATLIILGKNSYFDNYWLDYRDFYTVYIVLYTFCISLSIFNFVSDYSLDNNKKAITSLVILCLLITAVFVPFAKDFMIEKNNTKKFYYCLDKMRIFYEYKGITPYMPATFGWNMFVEIRKPVSLDFESDEVVVYKDPFDREYFERIDGFYYPQAYHIEFTDRAEDIVVSENNTDAINYYKSLGGNFDEVKTGKYKFKNLEDKNFVLGVQKTK